MLLSDFIRQGVMGLEALYPTVEAKSIMSMLCEDLLGVKSYTHIIDPLTEIPQERLYELSTALNRLLMGEPIQYVTGLASFYGRTFRVNPSVLIPRQETEQMVKEVIIHSLGLSHKSRVLDLCTGSGCIAWSVCLEVPDSEVYGIDISKDALKTAQGQFPLEENTPKFFLLDILSDCRSFDKGQFDIIVSNPPYIMESEKANMRRNVLDHEPSIALFVPDSDPLLFYRAIAEWMSVLLKSDGLGFVEINESLGEESLRVFKSRGYTKSQILKDLYGKERFLKIEK